MFFCTCVFLFLRKTIVIFLIKKKYAITDLTNNLTNKKDAINAINIF